MFLDEFDNNTAFKMEAALEQAFRTLRVEQSDYATRRLVAEQILECVRNGTSGLDELITVGIRAIERLDLRSSMRQVGGGEDEPLQTKAPV